jgi:hypothetical protein
VVVAEGQLGIEQQNVGAQQRHAGQMLAAPLRPVAAQIGQRRFAPPGQSLGDQVNDLLVVMVRGSDAGLVNTMVEAVQVDGLAREAELVAVPDAGQCLRGTDLSQHVAGPRDQRIQAGTHLFTVAAGPQLFDYGLDRHHGGCAIGQQGQQGPLFGAARPHLPAVCPDLQRPQDPDVNLHRHHPQSRRQVRTSLSAAREGGVNTLFTI